MIYLASTSPRRKELLKQKRIQFKIIEPDYHESNRQNLGPVQLVKKHAFEKGKSCVPQIKNGIILSADTIVYIDGRIVGKPRNLKNAFRILKELQNRWHRVYTGVAILEVHSGKITRKKIFSESTRVKLKSMSDEDIKRYFKKTNPMDKAGAYAIQSKRTNIIRDVKGSLTNAIGLPMETLLKKIKGLNR